MTVNLPPLVEGRAYLYNFDFLRFRESGEETFRPTKLFVCAGICWKLRHPGVIQIFKNGQPLCFMQVNSEANAMPLAQPFSVTPEDDLCIVVTDSHDRRLRWFRRNSAHVTLEGLECEQ